MGKSSVKFSTLSMRDSIGFGSASTSVAMYKGQTVAVFSVDKPEISLTGKDLVELVNVCTTFNLLIGFPRIVGLQRLQLET